ncbi:2'-5' RNA ligase family protein [Halobacteriaceae bacterium SHR40]|mgnify:CR=1 FL=1|uniref:2'-5' RNA ligase family protein n=1 Tax=Halovenus amylolytica TaxID=2500550 RepID=UPI000FE31484
MYSLNVPVPGQVGALAVEIARQLPSARARTRGEHTLGVKRLGSDAGQYSRIEAQAREALAGQPAFEARIDEIDIFEDPPVGTAPVVYLAVDSPGLRQLHQRLVDIFGSVSEGIEGESYTPHVTIARGGSLDAAKRVAGAVDPIEWTVSKLQFWDAKHNQSVSTVSLPA